MYRNPPERKEEWIPAAGHRAKPIGDRAGGVREGFAGLKTPGGGVGRSPVLG